MISLDRIIDAHKKITPYINYTPLIYSEFLLQVRLGISFIWSTSGNAQIRTFW